MSNLLDKSSILLTPTAYDNGKILSVKPAPSLSSELMPSTATIANLGGGSITQITENIYSSTSDGTSGSAVRPKFDFNTTSGKIYKLVITPIGTITGTINFDFYDGSTYLFQDYDFTTIKEITFKDNGTVFGAFNGQLAYSISNFKISVKEEIDGDFDFTRNSSATRVSSQGLIEDVQILSSNLVTNGDFATDSDWNKINSTVSGGTGNLDGDGQTSLLYQNILTNGKTYKVTFTVSDYNSLGEARIIESSGSAIYTITSNGTFTFTFTHSNADGNFLFRARTGAIFSVDNVSVIEITDDTNLPRIDYTGGVGHWLFEPSSTNLLTYSEDFATGWTKFYLTLTAESTTSPDGSLTGTKVQITNDNTAGLLTNNIAITSGLTYTQTVYAKAGTYGYLHMTGSTGFNSSRYQSYDLVNGVLINGSGGIESSIENVGNGWYRCTYTDVSILSASGRIVIGVSNNSGRLGGSGLISGDNIYLWGAQLEVGSFSTSYIPTTTTQVTRLQDAATGAGSSDLINSTEGVLYAEIAALAEQTLTRYITLSDGTSSNRIIIYITDVGVIKFFVGVGGVTQAAKTVSGQTTTNFNKLAVSYKEDDIKFYLNGVKVHTDTSASTFPANTLNVINFAASNGTSSSFFGKAKCLAVFKESLTDAELTCLTTI